MEKGEQSNVCSTCYICVRNRGWKTTYAHLFNIQTYNGCTNQNLINMIAVEGGRIKIGGRNGSRIFRISPVIRF